MKINKEQEVVMEIHKKNDSKVHKKSDGKVKSKMTSARTKGRAIAGEASSVTAAGSAAGPYGMAIGAAVGKAAEMQIDTAVYKTEKKMRMLKYFKDKLQTPENQNDNIIRVAVDLVKMKAGLMIRRAVSMLAPVVIPIIIIIAAVGGLVMAIFTVLYNSPLAFLLPRLSDGETIHSVTTQYVAEFNERVQKRADEHKDADEGRVIYVDYEGVSETPSNYYDIMCVYMVRYGYKNTATDMNVSNKGKLQQVVKVGYEYSQARRFSGTAFDCSSLVYCAWKAAGI